MPDRTATGLARVHLQREETDSAIVLLKATLARKKSDAYVRGLYGVALRQGGRLAEARSYLQQGRNEKPNWDDPWELETG